MGAEQAILLAGMALCVFALWAIIRHDWLRLTRPGHRVLARVVGHTEINDSDERYFTARYAFHDGLAEREVTDMVGKNRPRPEIGTNIELVYPEGRPDLARPARPLLWLVVYLGLIYALGVLVAKWLGYI
jgi:hypothetical protein